jgi:hypothetical protein
MKHLLLLVMFVCFATVSFSQIVFRETFDGIAGPTAGGAGTYTFPTGWRLRNVDARTPAASVSYVNEAWERREDFGANVADSCAFSTSWYSPVGAADDWMWTPLIGPLPGNSVLSWRAKAYDASYPDGYEVRLMTAAAGPPTGGTAVMGNQVTSSTVLFSTAAESSSWTTHTVNLNAYAGQSVYIAFRNNSNDKFMLVVDDVKVEVVVNYDAEVTAANSYEFTQAPKKQASIPLGGTIKNSGQLGLTNVSLQANVYNSSNTLLLSSLAFAVPTLAAGASNTFSLTNFTPVAAGTYTIKYFPVISESDGRTSNDTVLRTVVITDSVFARDNGTAVGQLGIGVGNGYLGQSFTIQQTAELRSVTVSFTRGYVGKRYACVVWNTNGSGVPTTILASTDTLLYPDDNALTDTLPIYGGYASLVPGKYVVTAVEFDSTLQLAQTSALFTTGTEWVNWTTNPFGAWSNVEAFGASFSKAFYLRMNVTINANTPVITSNGGGASAGISLAENIAAVTSVTATDADAESHVYYVLNGGADAAKFSINGTTGALSFITPPDFDIPGDADANNSYLVVVRASDGVKTDDQTITVTLTNANDNTPVITSNGGGATANLSVLNPQQAVTTVTATDADGPLNTLSYSISGGVDAGDFTINSSSGALAFINPTNRDNPQDADLDNVYLVTVQVSDGTFTDQQTISVTVTGTMPVTLVSLKGYLGGSHNIIEWSTVNESGMDSYDIEKSSDGNSFARVGTAAATQAALNEYRFTDLQPFADVSFYRLKMKERGGSWKYSAIIRLQRPGVVTSVNVYPNPARNTGFTLQLVNLPADSYELRLYNNAGQLVLEQLARHAGGSSSVFVGLPAPVKPGMYLLLVGAGELRYTKKVFIIP